MANCRPFVATGLLVADALEPYEALRLPRSFAEELGKMSTLPPGSSAWRDMRDRLPNTSKAPAGVHGYLEGVLASPEGGLVAAGWALHPADMPIWIEDEFGTVQSLSTAFRRARGDVTAAYAGAPWAEMDCGFIMYLADVDATATLRLCAATEDGVVTLSVANRPEALPAAPALAAQRLFGIETEDHLFHRRVPIVDMPVLGPLIERRQAELAALPVTVTDFGDLPSAPAVSIIIPLYRRFDFIEHQLIEFIRDPGLLASAELVYVIDDPDIHADVMAEVARLHNLYALPLRLVSGVRNRGFSGANNLGAAHARGGHLLFMNSDVVPIAPGWLAEMQAGFDADDVGIVGAQLLFPDGGVQHSGMEFRFLDRFGIWSNQHPGAGLPPDPADATPRTVPAVTGACLLIPRDLFDAVGGWDASYLIGDFEDSHLCLAVRATGGRIVLQPRAMLTHLERQSFTGVGGDYFRVRMTIFNGVRHQMRWAEMLAAPAEVRPVMQRSAA